MLHQPVSWRPELFVCFNSVLYIPHLSTHPQSARNIMAKRDIRDRVHLPLDAGIQRKTFFLQPLNPNQEL
jgi:hypothetical protein